MQSTLTTGCQSDRKVWFSMWFLGALITFGLAFFPMFYRLVEGRNRHFQNEAQFKQHIAESFKNMGKEPPEALKPMKERNAKLWAASIFLILPAFVILFLLTKDIIVHEQKQDIYLAEAFLHRAFMPQTVPLTTYVLITIVTLGLGGYIKSPTCITLTIKPIWQSKKSLLDSWRKKIMSSTCKKRRFVSHGGDIWGFSRKYNIPLEEVLEFSGPINFMGPPPKAVDAVKQNARLIKFYPDPNPVEFKQSIADYVGQGVKAENVLLGNGSIELIYMITEVLPPKFSAVIPVPSFSEYEKATLRVDGKVSFVQLPSDFSLENDKIKAAVTTDTKIMCLCNPHSPSGTLYSKRKIMDLVDFCHKKDVVFSIDENYIEFAEEGNKNTVAGMIKEYENLFVIRSVTKFYGMAGLRFGYAIAANALIDRLETMRQPWSINGLACQVTMAAFNDTEFIKNTKETITRNREQLA
jgi:threonine-phosphate decarboxylase